MDAIMNQNAATVLAMAAAVGVALHLGYFIRGEHHLYGFKIIQSALLGCTATTLLLIRVGQLNFGNAVLVTTLLAASCLAGLFSSMLLYRAFFHRLGSFPGPFGAKLSKFWHVCQLGGLDNYKRLDKWHSQYGEYVRIGPSELSIVDPNAVDAIMGTKSACIKSDWYDAGQPLVSMHQSRDRAQHDKRRRVWDRGFSMKALEAYDSRVKSFANDLLRQVKAFGGKPLNVSLWFNYYSFDVMGELAFGQSFDMLKTGEQHYAIKLLSGGQRPLGLIGPMPWLTYILTKLPGLGAGYKRFIKFSEEQAEKRQKMAVKERDIMSWLLEAEPMEDDAFRNHMWLVGDARLIIVAGSDTTAATLTYIFYHLAKDPSQVDKLRQELAPLVGSDKTFETKDLANADHLNGVINEALRLHPPVPSGVFRKTPPEGIMIGERRIPGETTVSVPLWTVGRSPKAFQRPEEFVPERWFSQPELVLNPKAYAPFSIGRYGCIGKNLALMELRTVTALLVTHFDVTFAPGEDGSKLINESEDYFTIGLGDMMLQFTPRK